MPELNDWTMKINYGPEGEANYANVYSEAGEFVGNLKTHHANAIVAAFAAQQRRASVVTPDQKWVKNLAARISVDVCEIERDSPEDDPMACVVYAPEIDAIVVRRVTEALAACPYCKATRFIPLNSQVPHD